MPKHQPVFLLDLRSEWSSLPDLGLVGARQIQKRTCYSHLRLEQGFDLFRSLISPIPFTSFACRSPFVLRTPEHPPPRISCSSTQAPPVSLSLSLHPSPPATVGHIDPSLRDVHSDQPLHCLLESSGQVGLLLAGCTHHCHSCC